MKKITKTILAMACVATLGAGVFAMAGCGGDKQPATTGKTGEAYALVHGGHYVGKATITIDNSKITEASLTEVCLPTYITIQSVVSKLPNAPTDADAAAQAAALKAQQDDAVSKIDAAHKTNPDYVVDTIVDHGVGGAEVYYKSVSYGDVKLTYTAGVGYKDANGKTLNELLATEANCKVFYNAVMEGNVSVKVGGVDKKDIMTEAKLSKDKNGYWTKEDSDGNEYSRWKLNRDATLKYVKENGVASLLTLVRDVMATEDAKGAQAKYWRAGTLSTGATWSDFGSKPTSGYISYAQLIVNAHTAANK